jgi:hypothetical protein
MRSLRAEPMEAATDGAERSWYQLDLPLADLAPGEYVVEAVAGAGNTRARETLTFRVAS